MKKFWSNLAVQLGKRAGAVSVVGLAITLVLGLGITQLQFATGQDSYLNKDDQVAKDNVAYQNLFGGQIMLVLFTMDDGHNVSELADPGNRKVLEKAKAEILDNPSVEAVLSPIDTLEFSANLISRTPDEPTDADAFNPLESIAKRTLDGAQAAEESGSPGEEARQADLDATTTRVAPFLADPDANPRTLDNAEWVDVLLRDNEGAIRKPLLSSFFDDTHAQMIVRLEGNADIETEGAGAIAVKDAWADRTIDGGDTLVTGAPVLLKDINDYLKGGILSLGAIAVAIMVVILLLFFKVRWRLLPLGVILVGVTWAFGLAGYLGIPLSIVTIAGLPVMLGIGIDYAIQMHARVEEEVLIDRAEHPIQETARNLGPALLVVTFDALFAFAALRFAKVPMIRDFALILAIGIAVICITSIILPLAILGIREFKSPTKGRDYREGALGSFVVKLGSLPATLAPLMIGASLLIFAGGIFTEGKLTLQTDPVEWVNQDSQNRKDVATLEEETGASSELGIFVTAEDRDQLLPDVPYKDSATAAEGEEAQPCFADGDYVVGNGCYSTEEAATLEKADQTMSWMESFTSGALDRYEDDLLVGSSILTPLSDLADLEGASNDYAPSSALVAAAYEAAPQSVRDFTVAKDSPAFNVLFITRPGSLNDRADMVNDMRDRFDPAGEAGAVPPEGIEATPSGLAVVGVGLLENLESNRVLLTYLSIGLVFLFLTVRLRSITRSLLSLVPVLIAVGTASLIAFSLSLKLSPMTAVGGPLVIAVCTEFTSLILLRFIEERERGLSPQAAADVTAARTGRAFIVSALTAVVGVGVIATSSLPLLRDFGIVVAMNVFVALASALTILPPIMVWAEGKGWVTKGLVDPSKLGNKLHDEATATPNLAGSTD